MPERALVGLGEGMAVGRVDGIASPCAAMQASNALTAAWFVPEPLGRSDAQA